MMISFPNLTDLVNLKKMCTHMLQLSAYLGHACVYQRGYIKMLNISGMVFDIHQEVGCL